MAYKTCPDCGSRIAEYGCTWCNEQDYIDMQGAYDKPDRSKNKIKERDDPSSNTEEVNK